MIKENIISRITHHMGLSYHTIVVSKFLQRPEWMYRDRKNIPPSEFFYSPALPVTADDVVLCERLLAAYAKATETDLPPDSLSKIWQIMLARYGKLFSALNEAKAEGLAATLSTMFKEEFLYGISSASEYTGSQTRLGSKIWSQKYLEDVVALAEYLGVVRTECPQQGVIGYAFKDGLEALVKKIEAAIGISIGFPEVGAAYGIKIGDALITFESQEHIYAALRVNEAIDAYLSPERAAHPHVLEIGAGFGGTGHWLLKIRQNIESYTIIDLPIINVLQGYFLAKVFGASKVSLFGEGDNAGTPPRGIRVWPAHALGSIEDESIDALFNENSMPEIPEHVVENYLGLAKNKVAGIFYSYNQEAYSPVDNVPQVLVPEAVARVGGFKRLSRNYSWLRRGYVEETYLTENLSQRESKQTSEQR
jgi:hypothetical protein